MSNVNFPLAPKYLNQSILPGWDFNLFNIDLGASNNPQLEAEILKKVGSYGKQIGHMAAVVEVLANKLEALDKDLTQQEKDALTLFKADLLNIRSLRSSMKS